MKHNQHTKRLSPQGVEAAEVGLHPDGAGIYLQVTRSKGGQAFNRSWLLRYTFNGRERWCGLGYMPKVGLALARKAAESKRALIAQGIEPISHKRTQRRLEAQRKTFRQAAEAYHAAHKADWRSAKHSEQWLTSLERHVFPSLGWLPCNDITSDRVMETFDHIWKSLASAPVLLGRTLAILSWAESRNYRSSDNLIRKDVIIEGLGARGMSKRHHKAIPWSEMPAVMAELESMDDQVATFLRLIALTGVRLSNLVEARWQEFDLAKKLWTVPQTKNGYPFRCPLSSAAIIILKSLPRGDMLFAGMDQHSPLQLLQRIRPATKETVHGLRSSFRDWLSDQVHVDHDIGEACIQHFPRSATVEAYLRTDHLARRKPLMQKWADYLATPTGHLSEQTEEAGAEVVPLRAVGLVKQRSPRREPNMGME